MYPPDYVPPGLHTPPTTCPPDYVPPPSGLHTPPDYVPPRLHTPRTTYPPPPVDGLFAGGTHPTGMHSCVVYVCCLWIKRAPSLFYVSRNPYLLARHYTFTLRLNVVYQLVSVLRLFVWKENSSYIMYVEEHVVFSFFIVFACYEN